MCGLFGWIKGAQCPLTPAQLMHLTTTLAVLNESRGSDSTGVASFRTGEAAPLTCKKALAAREFIPAHLAEVEMACRVGAGWLIGHTRSKTQGDVTDANAHPFHFGKVLGAHNGVIHNYEALAPLVKEKHTLPGCDSAALFALADKKGMVAALKETRGWLNLTYATAPYDGVTLYQDLASGIALAYVPQWRMAVWSSDDDHLALACSTLGIAVAYDPDATAPGYYMALPQDTLATMLPTDIDNGTCTDREAGRVGGTGLRVACGLWKAVGGLRGYRWGLAGVGSDAAVSQQDPFTGLPSLRICRGPVSQRETQGM